MPRQIDIISALRSRMAEIDATMKRRSELKLTKQQVNDLDKEWEANYIRITATPAATKQDQIAKGELFVQAKALVRDDWVRSDELTDIMAFSMSVDLLGMERVLQIITRHNSTR